MKRGRRFKESEKGQASILIGGMMMTFILLFAFVVNTGMLVHAKINLQNAADMAAYAGASVQARQLNQIGYLNYEMRRQYKKFLFRYFVLGTLSQANSPRNPDPAPRMWSPGLKDPNNPSATPVDFGVPGVCVIFSTFDNYCQLPILPQLKMPKPVPLDTVNTTLIDQLKRIENLRSENCEKIGLTNRILMTLWLANTDPSATNYGGGTSGFDQKSVETLSALTEGLGIIPREVLLKQRIDTMAKYYVNAPVKHNLTFNDAEALKKAPDPAIYERTIQAFYSAYNSLGDHVFDNVDSIVMDEILPMAGDNAQVLMLKDIKVPFDAYAIDFASEALTQKKTGKAPSQSNGQTGPPKSDCTATPVTINTGESLPVGVAKDPEILTYYAVRLKANAKLLFNPFGADLTLKAYAAARPFGSRIGPMNIGEDDFRRPGVFAATCKGSNSLKSNCKEYVPNLPVLEDEKPETGRGWDNRTIQGALYEALAAGGSVGPDGQMDAIGPAAIKRAYHYAMVPNPWEFGKYNIPDDLADEEPFIVHFGPDHRYRMWAPLTPPSERSDEQIMKAIKDQIANLVIGDANKPTSVSGGQDDFAKNFSDQITANLKNYVSLLRKGQGEDNEGIDVAVLHDPFTDDQGQEIHIHRPVEMTLRKDVRSGWVTKKDPKYHDKGRTGYSVKFVSFASLMSGNSPPSDGHGATWKNKPMLSDGEFDLDVLRLDH